MDFFRSVWQALKGWLFAKQPSRASTFGNPDLYPIDTEKIAKELGVESEAERLGKRELPDLTATELTGIESKIIQVIEKARQDYLDWGNDRLKHLNQDISAIDLSLTARQVRQLDAEFERRASGLLDSWVATLRELGGDISEKEREYETFRNTNDLARPPAYPRSAETYLRHTILLGLIVVEGGLNSVFFAQGAWGGLLEGFFYAVLFAAGNIGLAWLYGRHFIPQILHVNPLRRVIGVILVPICVISIAAVAFVIAHFRDAATTGNIAGAAQLALIQLRSSPFELKDIYSWLLVFLSIVFAIFAMIDSFGLDDRYPGYGKTHRALRDVKDDYEADMETVRSELSSLKEEILEELERLLDRLQVNCHRLGESISQKEAVERRLHTAFVDVDNCIDALIQKFRTSNRVHRNTQGPQYFSTRPHLRPITVSDFDIRSDRVKYEEQRQILQGVQGESHGIRASIQVSFNKQFDRLIPIEEQLSKRGSAR